jgi:hypothetical protein
MPIARPKNAIARVKHLGPLAQRDVGEIEAVSLELRASAKGCGRERSDRCRARFDLFRDRFRDLFPTRRRSFGARSYWPTDV